MQSEGKAKRGHQYYLNPPHLQSHRVEISLLINHLQHTYGEVGICAYMSVYLFIMYNFMYKYTPTYIIVAIN